MSLVQPITPQTLTAAAFAPYGQAIWSIPDHQPFTAADAQLSLDRGIPRFYIMRLQRPSRQFDLLTRHHQCTQCLAAVGGREWFLAVAPPSPDRDHPDLGAIAVFRIPGSCFVKLHLGTWHNGPFFDTDTAEFFNLELSDTNLTDHETARFSSLSHAGFTALKITSTP